MADAAQQQNLPEEEKPFFEPSSPEVQNTMKEIEKERGVLESTLKTISPEEIDQSISHLEPTVLMNKYHEMEGMDKEGRKTAIAKLTEAEMRLILLELEEQRAKEHTAIVAEPEFAGELFEKTEEEKKSKMA